MSYFNVSSAPKLRKYFMGLKRLKKNMKQKTKQGESTACQSPIIAGSRTRSEKAALCRLTGTLIDEVITLGLESRT